LDAVSDREFIREPVVENSAIQGAEAGEALEAIEHLQGLDREIFVLRYVEDLSVKEIAKIVNKSENAVSVRINRGIQKIRKMLEVDHGSKSERGRESFEGQRATTSKGAQAN
jgi:RNA polymerase sigma-70 factor (ECF subfamily)